MKKMNIKIVTRGEQMILKDKRINKVICGEALWFIKMAYKNSLEKVLNKPKTPLKKCKKNDKLSEEVGVNDTR